LHHGVTRERRLGQGAADSHGGGSKEALGSGGHGEEIVVESGPVREVICEKSCVINGDFSQTTSKRANESPNPEQFRSSVNYGVAVVRLWLAVLLLMLVVVVLSERNLKKV
jgi:hypothetical protein